VSLAVATAHLQEQLAVQVELHQRQPYCLLGQQQAQRHTRHLAALRAAAQAAQAACQLIVGKGGQQLLWCSLRRGLDLGQQPHHQHHQGRRVCLWQLMRVQHPGGPCPQTLRSLWHQALLLLLLALLLALGAALSRGSMPVIRQLASRV